MSTATCALLFRVNTLKPAAQLFLAPLFLLTVTAVLPVICSSNFNGASNSTDGHFKTLNNQSLLQRHQFRTPDTTADSVSESTKSTDSSLADIILHISNTDSAEKMSSAELCARTGGRTLPTKPVDVVQPTGKPRKRQRQAENSEDS
ncbi:hypothetical protein HOY82DRAFT_604985 [Tuber indicum]|nr:hypothetical protein HOY82DRAFT_604985 [Tuber indicum]